MRTEKQAAEAPVDIELSPLQRCLRPKRQTPCGVSDAPVQFIGVLISGGGAVHIRCGVFAKVFIGS